MRLLICILLAGCATDPVIDRELLSSMYYPMTLECIYSGPCANGFNIRNGQVITGEHNNRYCMGVQSALVRLDQIRLTHESGAITVIHQRRDTLSKGECSGW